MSAAKVVAAGRELLNRDFPGWEKLIDVDELDLGSHRSCVLGQLAWKDPRLSELIRGVNERRREQLLQRGWDPLDIRAMPEDFFTACMALEFDEDERRAQDFGFDFSAEITLDALQDEWGEVIGDELSKWESKEES